MRPLHNPVFFFSIVLNVFSSVVQALEVFPVTLLQWSVYKHSVFRALDKAHCFVTNTRRLDRAQSTRLRGAFPPIARADIYRVHSAVVCTRMASGPLKMSGVYDSVAVCHPRPARARHCRAIIGVTRVQMQRCAVPAVLATSGVFLCTVIYISHVFI